ncbi:hypothetical protein SDC9_188422 [bioreactor metagenome]|uniref:Uncharacterized protein n=1 Tax=bioreactor metagenome TaxID=1076179 RepID=A0A645HR08_9ZZZZ
MEEAAEGVPQLQVPLTGSPLEKTGIPGDGLPAQMGPGRVREDLGVNGRGGKTVGEGRIRRIFQRHRRDSGWERRRFQRPHGADPVAAPGAAFQVTLRRQQAVGRLYRAHAHPQMGAQAALGGQGFPGGHPSGPDLLHHVAVDLFIQRESAPQLQGKFRHRRLQTDHVKKM